MAEVEDVVVAQVIFGIRSHWLTPEAISQALGIAPSHERMKGAQYKTPSGRLTTATAHVWQLLSEGRGELADPEIHARKILSQLEPKADEVRKIMNHQDVIVDIRIWWEAPEGGSGYALQSNTAARLANLCQTLSLSFTSVKDD